jgi:hypothetical protein
MAGGAPLPVREYTDAAAMQRDAAALRARMFAPRPAPPSRRPVVKIIDLTPAAPAPVEVEPAPEPVVPLEEIVAVAPTSLPATTAQREGRASLRGTDCLRIGAQVSGMLQREITGQSRLAHIAKIRQIVAWLLVNRAGMSLPQAGRFLGGRDHTTILHACRQVDAVVLPASAVRGDAVMLVVALWDAMRPASYPGRR